MQMIKDEIRYTKAELAGGTGLGMVTLIGVVVFLMLSGCNKRIYIGMDDYGDTKSMSHEFKTGNGGEKQDSAPSTYSRRR